MGGSADLMGADGAVRTVEQPMTTFTYTAQYVTYNGLTGWRLMTSTVGEAC